MKKHTETTHLIVILHFQCESTMVMKVQTELTESGVQSISDLPSLDPVRVSVNVHTDTRKTSPQSPDFITPMLKT
jgi:hypothetical protein